MLKNKVIVVTGGGRGIGRSISLACASQGAKVVIVARSENEIVSVANEIKEKYDTDSWPITCDVSSEKMVKELYQRVEKDVGPVYGLVCAAGIYGPIGRFAENDFEEWSKAVQINLFGTALCVHRVLPSMIERKEGRLVLFSGGGQGAMPNFTSYVTSKGGVWRLVETLGKELSGDNIYINAIAPGAVNTRFLQDILDAGEEKVGKDIYQNSLKQKKEGGTSPEKAAECTLYLLSDKSKGLSGKILSAVWDPYREFKDNETLSDSDIFTMKRVVDEKGSTRFS